MKQYFLKAAGTATLLAFFVTAGIAQDDKLKTTTTKNSSDVIVINPKVNTDTKLTIEIKGDVVTVNGKPLAEYKSDDVKVSRRKQMTIETTRRDGREHMENDMDKDIELRIDDDGEGNMRLHNKKMAELDQLRTEDMVMDAKRQAEIAQLRARAGDRRFRSNGGAAFGPGEAQNRIFVRELNGNAAFLGVGTDKTEEGARIQSVAEESPAAKAGLKEGDIITKINDTKISSPEELTKAIGKFKPEDKITITYKRDKKEQKTTAILAKRKPSPMLAMGGPNDDMLSRNFNFDYAPFTTESDFMWGAKPKLGIKAQETEDGKGLKVLDVDDESAAEKAGIKEGDIITSFDGTAVNDIDKLRELSKPAIEKGNFKVQLTRDGKQQEIDVKIPKKLKTTSL